MSNNKYGISSRNNGYPMQPASYPALPTGMPTGAPFGTQGSAAMPVPVTTPSTMGMPSVMGMQAATPAGEPPITTLTSKNYVPGYLRTQIGRRVKVEFLIGTNMLIDREGTLMEVGASYIILQESETDDLLLCDLYSIKFVEFFY